MFRTDDQIVNQRFGNGLVDQRVYTARGLLSNWDLTGRKAHDRDYSYDDNGNQLGWNSNSTSAAYQYDALDRLIDEQQGRYHNAYSYDANGNRLSQLLPDGGTKAYSYAPQSNRMTQNGGTAVRLDAAGNTLDDGKYQYRYDAADRLAEVQQGGQAIARYRYDYQGLRRQKITAEGTTDFTYDTSGHLISQQTKGSQDNGQRDYLWTDTAPIARIDSQIGQAKVHKNWLPQALMGSLHRHEGREHNRAARLYYFHTDAMGTPRLATDAKQQVVWRWNEDAFGAKVSTDQVRHGDRNEWGHRDLDWDHGRRHGIQVNLRYPGQYYDSETGLFYNWNRYYDPSTGRYGRSDPISLSGGVNTYSYAFNSPAVFNDPLGLDSYNLGGGLGFGPGVNYSVSIDPSTLNVYVTVGIGTGIGVSGSATYSNSTPSQGYAWNFEGAGGLPPPLPLGGSVSAQWDASSYATSGLQHESAAWNIGTGFAAGFSATGTFQGTWEIGNLANAMKWWERFFGNSDKSNQTGESKLQCK